MRQIPYFALLAGMLISACSFSAAEALAGNGVFAETTFAARGGAAVAINGFPVVDLPDPDDGDVTMSSNSLIGGYLKNGVNELEQILEIA